ncbi:MAG: tetratricopeptide repeat protein, partial [Candidatus Margulisbacteria bacterium]|nr:tetratricopeptide repeat protein [Candidatus Margulisiibacteriota bacterium]
RWVYFPLTSGLLLLYKKQSVYFQKGDIDRAIAEYEKVLAIDPTNANATEALMSLRALKYLESNP